MPRPKKDENSPKRTRITKPSESKRPQRETSGDARRGYGRPPQQEERLKGVSGQEYRERKARLQRELDGKPAPKEEFERRTDREKGFAPGDKRVTRASSAEREKGPFRRSVQSKEGQPFEKKRNERDGNATGFDRRRTSGRSESSGYEKKEGFSRNERPSNRDKKDFGRTTPGRRSDYPTDSRYKRRDESEGNRSDRFKKDEAPSERVKRDYSRPPLGEQNEPFRRERRGREESSENRARGDRAPGRGRNNYESNERPGAHRPRLSGRSKPLIKLKPEEASDTIRLNKYIADAGVCSRRDADNLIALGEIRVNGAVVTEMGFQVKPTDVVKYGNRLLKREKLVYILMNKPKDFITTLDDPEDRKTVIDLLGKHVKERVYPVGRLDRNTTGLLLLTNDGELADKLSHPSGNIKKVYQVEIDTPITKEDIEKLRKGVTLEDGPASIDSLEILEPNSQVIGLELHSGRNRIVRRLFEHLGYKVTKLDRVLYADLTKKDLPRGSWRYLTEKEVIRLKYFV
jgi:23S rRNA pseudouridine2605 synthase